MSRCLRCLALVAVVCLSGAMIGLALRGEAGHAAVAKPAVMAPIPKPPSGSRIWYRAGHYPRLTLPDGRQKIVRSVLNITKPMRFGSFVWNDNHIPKGSVWVRIDLARQLLSVFRDGHEIGSAVILYGTDGKPTPTGEFTILAKYAKHFSYTYGDAPMPYTLRLTKDGVAIHGSNVREGWATHGCIGVPLNFARRLFSVASKGDLVVILPAQSKTGKA